jgi:hypothetical protein
MFGLPIRLARSRDCKNCRPAVGCSISPAVPLTPVRLHRLLRNRVISRKNPALFDPCPTSKPGLKKSPAPNPSESAQSAMDLLHRLIAPPNRPVQARRQQLRDRSIPVLILDYGIEPLPLSGYEDLSCRPPILDARGVRPALRLPITRWIASTSCRQLRFCSMVSRRNFQRPLVGSRIILPRRISWP